MLDSKCIYQSKGYFEILSWFFSLTVRSFTNWSVQLVEKVSTNQFWNLLAGLRERKRFVPTLVTRWIWDILNLETYMWIGPQGSCHKRSTSPPPTISPSSAGTYIFAYLQFLHLFQNWAKEICCFSKCRNVPLVIFQNFKIVLFGERFVCCECPHSRGWVILASVVMHNRSKFQSKSRVKRAISKPDMKRWSLKRPQLRP